MKKSRSCVIVLLLVAMLLPMLCSAAPVQAAQTQSAVQTVEVGIPVEENPELFVNRSMPTHGEGKIAVFLIDFPDYRNDNPAATQEYYDKLYFTGGVDTSWGNTTVAQFYREQSYGKLNLSGRVFDWYTAKHERSYYDNRKAELVMEAAAHYQAQGVDFSQFDGDGDGVIDSIGYHFAGECSASQGDPWYTGVCYVANDDGWGQIGNKKFTTIVQVMAAASDDTDGLISIVCHELMHTLGMFDLYGKSYHALGETTCDLMSENSQTINPYTKILLGWLDTVKVITGDATDIKLNLYGGDTPGDIAIVTDEFNGFFDEFYLVAYRYYAQYKTAVIWHIDARLNEQGTGFAYSNQSFHPRPDQAEDPSSVEYFSPYLFIEEISADPNFDFVLNASTGLEQTAFGESSSLGPNSMPSSDTHDGVYTGIQMDHFVEHNDKYLTFDVSFVEDTAAPVITTGEDDLGFTETIKLKFNEHVYAGNNWNQVKVTDLDGNALDATILLPHYPRNEVEITFHTDAYKDGYKIAFPKGAVRDSSGNELAAVTLTASRGKFFLPVSEEQLPNPGYKRDNGIAYFFPQEDSLVVITGLWEGYVPDAKIEFMRLDYNGNVLTQTVLDNPFEGSYLYRVKATEDGSYIVVCNKNCQTTWGETTGCGLLFCIDANGNIKWVNGTDPSSVLPLIGTVGDCYSFTQSDGLIMPRMTGRRAEDCELVHINSENGKTTVIDSDLVEILCKSQFFALSTEKFIVFTQQYQDGKYGTSIQIRNSETFELLASGYLVGTASDYHSVNAAYQNDDGTILLACDLFDPQTLNRKTTEWILLDAELNVVKSISRKFLQYNTINYASWFSNDGFCDINLIAQGNHDDSQYHIRRYDRYLNLMWEETVKASFIYYFQSPNGEILAYKSMLAPERECYIEYYDSEEAFRISHVHDIVYRKAVPATCQDPGIQERWQCATCGCYFSDKNGTPIEDIYALNFPAKGHTEQIIPAVAPACTAKGKSEGIKCTTCGDVLKEQQETVSATGHDWKAATCVEPSTCANCGKTLGIAKGHREKIMHSVAATCTETGLTEGTYCEDCGEILVAQKPISANGHKDADSNIVCDVCQAKLCIEHTEQSIPGLTPTCENTGLTEGTECATCGEILVAQETTPAAGHDWKDATCEEPMTCTVCSKTTGDATGHSFGAWTEVKAPTTEEAGLSERVCSACGHKEQQKLAKLEPTPTQLPTESAAEPTGEAATTQPSADEPAPANNTPVVMILCGIVLACAVAAAFVVIKKRT